MREETAMLAALMEKSMNLGPEWTITDVAFRESDSGSELHIYIERTPGFAVPCPRCGARCGVYDVRPREWRHLDIWQYKTIVHCDVPRADCPGCGVKTAKVPWSSDDATLFTALFETQVVLMAMSGMPVANVASLLHESDSTLWRMLKGLAGRAREDADFSGVTRVGVDETSRRKGHEYLTVFVDLDGERAMFCTKGRDASTVTDFAVDLREHGGDPEAVKVVTCDMSPAFAAGVEAELGNASIVIDRFHVMQAANRQLDCVRAEESKESEEKRRLLSRTKYIWLKNEENLTDRQRLRKLALSKERLKTGRAYSMVEALRGVYECEEKGDAALRLDALVSWITHSNVRQMKKVARMLRDHREGILAYFDERLTNARLEGMNSVIQATKRAARGFRNIENFEAMIYLKLGKLPLVESICAAT